ncbi:MAG: hypothetical protein ACD_44C00072G0007 [uncultured bacterium]|nr:MAG: hypothetical protein ACD_44C00072G0007 [uncultured bacterium]OGT15647.1 MAG: hypothetical protein A3B69_04650 [Gammaproteobacteria bacterium RIFCSPHIGHO2_02_FULL_38_33]OGT23369.1 MAG: hypothetical protein A2W47_04055 [Gammaproteobacteria bacterium RIFCSPHIGHO2_12_38_15]OGT66825.1 MAG: hypothetical protein A3I12_02045 [Gammaproteobacteria bacterium RIFCSPLOWO2_02_FULL_38_11]
MEVIRTQRGIGLLELMLSLAIIALLLVMATRYFSSARLSQQIAAAVSQVQAIAAASQSYYIGNNNLMTGVSTAIFASNNTYLVNPASTQHSPWGGNITIAPFGTNAAVTITIPDVPDANTCTRLIAALQGSTAPGAGAPSCQGTVFKGNF